VKRKHHKYSGVIRVGVDVKKKNGSLAQEMSFCVYSNRKLPKPEVPPGQMAPQNILCNPTYDFLRVDEEWLIGSSDERVPIWDGRPRQCSRSGDDNQHQNSVARGYKGTFKRVRVLRFLLRRAGAHVPDSSVTVDRRNHRDL